MKELLKITSVFLFLLFVSCNSKNIYEGHWVDEYSERRNLVIERNGSGYKITTNNGKYAAFDEGDKLRIEAQPVINVFIDDDGKILFKGIDYIKKELSMGVRGIGVWKNLSKKDDYIKIERSGADYIINKGIVVNGDFVLNQTENFTIMKFNKGQIQGEYYSPQNVEATLQLVDDLLVTRIGQKIEKYEKVKME